MVLAGSWGGGRFFMGEVPLYRTASDQAHRWRTYEGRARLTQTTHSAAVQGYLTYKKPQPPRTLP